MSKYYQNVLTRHNYRTGLKSLKPIVNHIYISFEVIGLYDIFKNFESGEDDLFPEYYREKTQTPRFSYKNHGVDIVYDLLDFEHSPCKITKKSLRRTGLCYSTARIYEGTDTMVKGILDYFSNNPYLYDFYSNHLHTKDIEKYLSFQSDVIEAKNQDKGILKIVDNFKKIKRNIINS